MKSNIHKMAGTPAGNGQLIIPELRNTSKKVASRRKKGTADPNAQSNSGINIYNPFTGRYVGDKQYSKIRLESGCDFKLLERNSHITGWNGKMTEEEFIATPESQVYLMGKNIKDIELTPVDELLLQESEGFMETDHNANMWAKLEPEATPSTTSHTAGTKSPVFTAEPDEVPLEKQSGFSLYNVCVKQSNDIDKLNSHIQKLLARTHKDTDLMEEMYHAGRKAIVKMENIIDRIGSELGINPAPF